MPSRDSRTLLDYGSDPNRLSPPPGNISQRTRSAAVAGSVPITPREEAHTPACVSRVPVAVTPPQLVTQNRAEYGHFNEARLLALRAHAGSDGDNSNSSVSAPAPPQHSGTDANAQPLAARAKQREASIVAPAPMVKASDQRSNDMSNKAVVNAGDKRKDSDTTVYVVPSKKRKKIAGEIEVAPGTVFHLPSFPNMRIVMGPGSVVTENNRSPLFKGTPQTKGPPKIKGPSEHQGFSCIGCINEELTDCNGQAHCNNCKGKCKYVLCKIPNCSIETCVKIHHSQYDLNARKSGETRRVVVYDNIAENSLTKAERLHLGAAIARMNNLRTGARIPGAIPSTSVSRARTVLVKTEDGDGETRLNALPGGAPNQSRDAQVAKKDVAQPAQTNTLPTEAPAFGAGSWQARSAQASLLTEAGVPAFGTNFLKPRGATDEIFKSNVRQAQNGEPGIAFGRLAPIHAQAGNVWQTKGAQVNGKGVGHGEPGSAFGQMASMHTKHPQTGSVWQASSAQIKGKSVEHGEPFSGFGSLAPMQFNPSQSGPFPIPKAVQAMRNTFLAAQTPAASDAIGAWVGPANRKDSFWSGDQHDKVEKRDD